MIGNYLGSLGPSLSAMNDNVRELVTAVGNNGASGGGYGNQGWAAKPIPKFVYTIFFGNLPESIVALPALGEQNFV